MNKILTALILTISILSFLIPQACCCQALTEANPEKRVEHSCCHRSVSATPDPGISTGGQIKERCKCEINLHQAVCTSFVPDYCSRYQEAVSILLPLSARLSHKVAEKNFNLNRGPPDSEALKALRIYLYNQVIRC